MLAVVALASACGVSLPNERMIEDLRILEVRAEPPETRLLEPGRTASTAAELVGLLLTAPSRERVRLSATVAHPDLDATFSATWCRCPPFSDLPCLAEETETDACAGPLVELATSTVGPGVVEFSPVDELRRDLASADEPEQVLAALAADPRDILNGLYAYVVLNAGITAASVRVDTQALDAEKRVVVFDPVVVKVAILEARRALADPSTPDLSGLPLPTLCTNVSEAELVDVFEFLDTRVPNRAPRYVGIDLDPLTVASSTRALGEGEVLTLRPGQEIALMGRADPAEIEDFRVIDDDCSLRELEETFAFSWFTTKGSLSRIVTSLGKKPGNRDGEWVTYQAPGAGALTEARTRVRIWTVLRDGRGGSEARTIELVVER
ncbi:hypothetical protein L6R52_18700 [Myxococcota bacterium]|nr:hypothetical protein [Myxococcota bacterium]